MKVACTGNAEASGSKLAARFDKLVRRKNPLLRDVFNRKRCDKGFDAKKKGFEIKDRNGNCWLNVHPEHLNVYDFTYWTLNHPGNLLLFPRNPIEEFAQANSTTLTFPASHEMLRWRENRENFGFVGRLYDTIPFADLPMGLRTVSTSEYFGFVASSDIPYENSTGVVVCGSPSEVANNLSLGGSLLHGAFDSYNRKLLQSTSSADFTRQKQIVWTTVALNSSDQLRQRVAWALAQILVISPESMENFLSEDFLTYYDIFVS